MSEWIEGMVINAKKEWEETYEEGDLFNKSKPYIVFESDVPEDIHIKGTFTIDQLKDLVVHFEKHKVSEKP